MDTRRSARRLPQLPARAPSSCTPRASLCSRVTTQATTGDRSTQCLPIVWMAVLLTALLPAVNAQDEKPTPAPSIYLRLSEEATVTALQLTDEQKTSITQIITELNTALEAEDADKPALTKAAGQKLEAVLTALQQKQLEELFAPKLKFNFRLQKWEAVLDWMADEAGLSLVMDDVPEGENARCL